MPSFRDHLGVTLLAVLEGAAGALMTNLFMLFLTDYAGLGSWAAAFGTGLMLVSRILDGFSSIAGGMVIDRAKSTRFGKYRPFFLLSILETVIGLTAMFLIPEKLSPFPVWAGVWIVLFYIVYSAGFAFSASMPLYRAITDNPEGRRKLLIGPRMAMLAVGVVSSFVLRAIAAVNQTVGNMHTSFGIVIAVLMASSGLLSLFGLYLVREKQEADDGSGSPSAEDERVRFREVFTLLKQNDALRIRVFSMFFSGFVWSLLFAAATYYLKWNFCTNLETGEVNTTLLGTLSLIQGMCAIVPMIIGTFVAGALMKRAGGAKRITLILLAVQTAACGILALLHFTGLMNPVFFTILLVIVSSTIGLSYIPSGVMNMEIMDYQVWKFGTDRSALCSSFEKFISKTQQALSTSMIGGLLILIGYEVDSVTDTFLGELSSIPRMMDGMALIMGLIPCVFGLISFLIMLKYPNMEEMRK